MPKLIAVQKGDSLDPAEAILIFEKKPDRPIRWWQSSAWEDLDLSVEVFNAEYEGFRPCELELPKNWEEGRVVVINGEASFKYND